jgi:hypothetical protein
MSWRDHNGVDPISRPSYFRKPRECTIQTKIKVSRMWTKVHSQCVTCYRLHPRMPHGHRSSVSIVSIIAPLGEVCDSRSLWMDFGYTDGPNIQLQYKDTVEYNIWMAGLNLRTCNVAFYNATKLKIWIALFRIRSTLLKSYYFLQKLMPS